MVKNLNFYQKKLKKFQKEDELIEIFSKNLLKTNRTHQFYVDWDKVIKKTKKFKYQLNLLNSLIDSDHFKQDFFDLIDKYPEVIETLPILIAIRDLKILIIEDFSNPDVNLIEYTFKEKKRNLDNFKNENQNKFNNDEKIMYFSFIQKTGLIKLFYHVKNLFDYVFGVEVGMDTHARKNRSGKSMEMLIKPILEKLCKKYQINLYIQKKFKKLKKPNIHFPKSLENRRCDFILIKNNKFLNIEVNFYRGSGSKPEEIVDSYINRYNEIIKANGYFIWITDGEAWTNSQNQIKKGFQNLPYIFNIGFIRKGLLEEAIVEIFT